MDELIEKLNLLSDDLQGVLMDLTDHAKAHMDKDYDILEKTVSDLMELTHLMEEENSP